MSKLYRPSNGAEGEIFCEEYCYRCVRFVRTGNDDNCDILGRTFYYDTDDPHYPTEWVVDDDGLSNPRCTAFIKEKP